MKRRGPAGRIHLLEFGLRWPPETFLLAKLEQLAARGVQITVACADAPAALVPPPTGIRVLRIVPSGRTKLRHLLTAVLGLALTRPLRLPAVIRAARVPAGDGRRLLPREPLGRLRTYARLASIRPDIVHFEWNTAAVHFDSLVDALGCPSVVSVRGGDLEIYKHESNVARLAPGLRNAFARATAVHCVSEAARREALAQGASHAKIEVIRPAVDPAVFLPRRHGPDESDDVFRVFAAGWLHWRKGWEYTLQAVARLAADGVPIVLDAVGPEPAHDMAAPSDRVRLVRAVDDLGLAGRVRLHGPLRHDDLRDLLQRADAVLHASLAEGIPNVVLEAMACGVPVVATEVGGTGEVLDDGVEGFLVRPRDPRAAAAALGALWEDPALRRRLGAAARARVAAQSTLAQQTDRWLALYDRVAADRPTARPVRLVEVGLSWPPEPFLRRKLMGLAERGFDVRVASILRRSEIPAELAGITLERLPHWEEGRIRAVLGSAADAIRLLVTRPRRAAALLRARRVPDRRRLRLLLRLALLRADVAHFEWTSFAETCSPLLRVWEFPVALSCHGSEVFVDHADRAELFSSVEAVHCVSRAVERAAHTGGLDEGRAQVIPSAVDPDVFRPPAEPPLSGGRYVVVTVGALRWVKGYEYALDTIARVAERGVPVRYEIVGSEPDESGDRRRIEVAVRELGIGPIVRLHGALSEPEIVRLLQRADVFLQASLSEGMPTAVLEAMACGLAVVATDVGGTREVLTTGVEGLLVAPRDSAAAADALAALWDESHRRRLLGAAARARATRFTLESQLAAFETFYKDLVA